MGKCNVGGITADVLTTYDTATLAIDDILNDMVNAMDATLDVVMDYLDNVTIPMLRNYMDNKDNGDAKMELSSSVTFYALGRVAALLRLLCP
jgi:hypothetical protein